MKHTAIVCVWVACAIVAGGCSGGGGGGTATTPFDPFATEPTPATGSEPAGVGDDAPSGTSTIASLCARACVHIESACPGSTAPNCPSDCASNVTDFPRCTVEFRAFVACVGTAPIICGGGTGLLAPACDMAAQALNACTA